MRHLWDTFRTILAVSLAVANNPAVNVDQLKLRLQMGYEATEEARDLVAEKQYPKASRVYADALGLGRTSAIAFQEMDLDNDNDTDKEDLSSERQRSLQWLVDVFCESCQLNMDHLDDLTTARADAWAACMFCQYQLRQPLECMKIVCERGEDLLGELQMCQHLLKLSDEELLETGERERISSRLQELDQLLTQK